MTEVMPFPKNDIVLSYESAPDAGPVFLLWIIYYVTRIMLIFRCFLLRVALLFGQVWREQFLHEQRT